MVPSYNDFMAVWQSVQPVESGLEFFKSPGVAEVTCVDEDVSIWYRGTSIMRVGYADHRYRVCKRFIWESFLECIEDGGNVYAGRVYELAPD